MRSRRLRLLLQKIFNVILKGQSIRDFENESNHFYIQLAIHYPAFFEFHFKILCINRICSNRISILELLWVYYFKLNISLNMEVKVKNVYGLVASRLLTCIELTLVCSFKLGSICIIIIIIRLQTVSVYSRPYTVFA